MTAPSPRLHLTGNQKAPRMAKRPHEQLPLTEDQARSVLLDCLPDCHRPSCPKCRGTKVYHLSDARMRCPRCVYTFHMFSRRWINTGGLTARQWLVLVHGFSKEFTARRMASELSISYNTAYKAMTTLRMAIVSQALDSRQFFGRDADIDIGFKPSNRGHRNNLSRLPIFGILERSGLVFIDHVPTFQAEDLFHFHLNFHLRLARIGQIIFTERYKGYHALISCGNNELPYHVISAKKGRPSIDSSSAFWSYAKHRLQQFNGITPRRFPLYLKELEFRYNNRHENIVPLLLRYLCSVVPNVD